MKRIEPGMLCLVTGGFNSGRECTTIRRVFNLERIPELGNDVHSLGEFWLIRGPAIHKPSEVSSPVWCDGYSLCRESRLMPISGGEKLEDMETVEDLESFT